MKIGVIFDPSQYAVDHRKNANFRKEILKIIIPKITLIRVNCS